MGGILGLNEAYKGPEGAVDMRNVSPSGLFCLAAKTRTGSIKILASSSHRTEICYRLRIPETTPI